MKAPLSWLRDYVDIDVSAQELKDKLFSCGFEVEELIDVGAAIDRCVVGKITSLEKHPDADKLQICKLDCGKYGSDIQIVTGADNVHVGDLVPVALEGASLANGIRIKKGKLRGVASDGMLCSGEELGINDDWYEGAEVYGILLLQGDIPLGTDIKEVVGLNDYIFDISVTANRPDCQSIYGIAREVAAVLGKRIAPVELTYPVQFFKTTERVNVTVEAPDLCPRYIAHYVRDIRIGKSPQWMRRRLALCGLRSINNVVDITNFVLLELGQPMHAFDLSKIAGDAICVRRAKEGEEICTLDEKKFKLTADNLVIADAEKPVALAGVMGGLNSGIGEDTAELLFESAKFERANIRHTSRALGQKSDSSARFEKGLDAYTTGIAISRALNLIAALDCGTIAEDRFDIGVNACAPKTVQTTYTAINALLGIDVPKERVKDILKSLNFSVSSHGDSLNVTVPAYREDVEGYPDIAEEVIRMYGYDNIDGTFLKNASVTQGGLNAEQKTLERTARALRMQDFSEIITYSFISPKEYERLGMGEEVKNAIRIMNPIGEDMSVMRTTLVPSMLATLLRNIRRGNAGGRLYEIAAVYRADSLPLAELPHEEKRVCVGSFGAGEDFYSLKGAFEAVAAVFGVRFAYVPASRPFLHPGKTAEVRLGDAVVGYLGELAPDLAEELVIETPVCLGELDYAAVAGQGEKALRYRPLPKFPEVNRDLALVADEKTTCAQLEAVIAESCKYITSVRLFDVYRSEQIGAGKKSMAFSLTFTPRDKAISPEDVDGYIKRILKALQEKLGISLR